MRVYAIKFTRTDNISTEIKQFYSVVIRFAILYAARRVVSFFGVGGGSVTDLGDVSKPDGRGWCEGCGNEITGCFSLPSFSDSSEWWVGTINCTDPTSCL